MRAQGLCSHKQLVSNKDRISNKCYAGVSRMVFYIEFLLYYYWLIGYILSALFLLFRCTEKILN